MKKNVLVVDDSESIREIVGYTLENDGYNVIKGVDGVDALQHLNGEGIDLVITDLNMPNMDGIGLIKKIRNHVTYQYVPILVLTTESQMTKKDEAREAGATGWIVKPFVKDKLLSVINKVLR
jgi:two-component system chemotaxis response regulator CheY